ncbi:hypothetical protein THRCLA_22527 [Thraustotheca clavata]|uniref:Crinkler (CRN) family protein n=1 Tax=Thraustotheca clavata TaxID=74557 RepID=A0A1V9YY71_9STRA|nr:hypothetical protein THRCLA_22527 [Thraustotheca clavata]
MASVTCVNVENGHATTIAVEKDCLIATLKNLIAISFMKHLDTLHLFQAAENGTWLSTTSSDITDLKMGSKSARIQMLISTDREIDALDLISKHHADMPTPSQQLRDFLGKELPVKITLNDTFYELVNEDESFKKSDIANKNFELKFQKKYDWKTTMIALSPVIKPSIPDVRADIQATFHHLWDFLIANVIESVATGYFNRFPTLSSLPEEYLPDMCFYYTGGLNGDVGVFRTEEDEHTLLPFDKLKWKYGDVPFIFGF